MFRLASAHHAQVTPGLLPAGVVPAGEMPAVQAEPASPHDEQECPPGLSFEIEAVATVGLYPGPLICGNDPVLRVCLLQMRQPPQPF